jgi:membrane protease YdiL (CAAX protease family)
MAAFKRVVVRRPVLIYAVLTFAISWGGVVAAAGLRGFGSKNWAAESSFPLVVLAMLAGPTCASLTLTGFLEGTDGLRNLLADLRRWRVGLQWYVLALVPAPLLGAAALFALALTSPIFGQDKSVVLLAGVAAGLTTVFEEIGWTGFAVSRLRQRHGIVSTGLMVGALWGAWHLLQQLWIAGTYAAGIRLSVYVPLSFLSAVAGLTAYRVLMVWVYDRTASLLLVTLMHASLTASSVFIFRPLAIGVPFLGYGWLFSAYLWILVAIVVFGGDVERRRGTSRPLTSNASRSNGREHNSAA